MTEVGRFEFDRLSERVERIEKAQRQAVEDALAAKWRRVDRINWALLGVTLLAAYSVALWSIAVAITEGR